MAWLAVAFVPWIALWYTVNNPGLGPWVKYGLPLLAASLLWLYRRSFGRPTRMETGTFAYFAFTGLMAVLGIDFFITYGDAVSRIFLGGLWGGTLASSLPLTSEYSKWHLHRAIWNTPVFVKTNAVITAVWAGVYLVQAVLALAGHHDPDLSTPFMVASNLLLAPAMIFTAWFQKWYPAYGSVRG